ncbi:hypothetical protein SNEBB_005487 [Seison nebaliae]|nr:hypothetical protein SNEBB_005487 [Seison nebaliae]
MPYEHSRHLTSDEFIDQVFSSISAEDDNNNENKKLSKRYEENNYSQGEYVSIIQNRYSKYYSRDYYKYQSYSCCSCTSCRTCCYQFIHSSIDSKRLSKVYYTVLKVYSLQKWTNIVLYIYFIIAVGHIILGLYIDQCPAEPNLPFYHLVEGFIQFILLVRIYERKKELSSLNNKSEIQENKDNRIQPLTNMRMNMREKVDTIKNISKQYLTATKQFKSYSRGNRPPYEQLIESAIHLPEHNFEKICQHCLRRRYLIKFGKILETAATKQKVNFNGNKLLINKRSKKKDLVDQYKRKKRTVKVKVRGLIFVDSIILILKLAWFIYGNILFWKLFMQSNLEERMTIETPTHWCSPAFINSTLFHMVFVYFNIVAWILVISLTSCYVRQKILKYRKEQNIFFDTLDIDTESDDAFTD